MGLAQMLKRSDQSKPQRTGTLTLADAEHDERRRRESALRENAAQIKLFESMTEAFDLVHSALARHVNKLRNP